MRVEIAAIRTIPEVGAGEDLARLVVEAAAREGQGIDSSVIAAVAQKVVSKAEAALVDLREVTPSPFAVRWAAEWDRDARLVEAILRQSRRVVKMDRGVMICETHHGFVCANAGVDQSNTASAEIVTVLPQDPDASARRLLAGIGCGAVVITDTFGRPWREGLVDVAIGVAGMAPLDDYRGCADRRGRAMTSTVIAIADQVAAAAGLVMRKSAGQPVALIRGLEWAAADGGGRELVRPPERDMFR